MGEKSSVIRDQYAMELSRYAKTVPMSEWPVYRGKLSRSGIAAAFRARGFSSFDRKRLGSAACRPVFREMNSRLTEWLKDNSHSEGDESHSYELSLPGADKSGDQTLKKARRIIADLEKDLDKSQREAAKFRSLCRQLKLELEQRNRQQSAFEEHCRQNLRTLHV